MTVLSRLLCGLLLLLLPVLLSSKKAERVKSRRGAEMSSVDAIDELASLSSSLQLPVPSLSAIRDRNCVSMVLLAGLSLPEWV